MTTEVIDPDEITDEVAEANDARKQYLMANGVQVPTDLMYAVSLLEFILGDEVDQARAFHERRIAPILDRSIAGLQQYQAQAQQAQARKTLLEGVR